MSGLNRWYSILDQSAIDKHLRYTMNCILAGWQAKIDYHRTTFSVNSKFCVLDLDITSGEIGIRESPTDDRCYDNGYYDLLTRIIASHKFVTDKLYWESDDMRLWPNGVIEVGSKQVTPFYTEYNIGETTVIEHACFTMRIVDTKLHSSDGPALVFKCANSVIHIYAVHGEVRHCAIFI